MTDDVFVVFDGFISFKVIEWASFFRLLKSLLFSVAVLAIGFFQPEKCRANLRFL